MAVARLIGTGIDADGSTMLAAGSQDLNWTVLDNNGLFVSNPYILTAAQVQECGYPTWNSTSYPNCPFQWVWLGPNGTEGSLYVPYTFQTTFDLTGANVNSATLQAWFSGDDNATATLNGLSSPISSFGKWTSMTWFNLLGLIPSGSSLIAGINTLSIQVTNTSGPGGFALGAYLQVDPVTYRATQSQPGGPVTFEFPAFAPLGSYQLTVPLAQYGLSNPSITQGPILSGVTQAVLNVLVPQASLSSDGSTMTYTMQYRIPTARIRQLTPENMPSAGVTVVVSSGGK